MLEFFLRFHALSAQMRFVFCNLGSVKINLILYKIDCKIIFTIQKVEYYTETESENKFKHNLNSDRADVKVIKCISA